MNTQDRIAKANEQHWQKMVAEGCDFTEPWLDLDRAQLRTFVQDQTDLLPGRLVVLYPTSILAGVEGKDVLCLASGGGQQSAVFGLLGARVTVVDLAEGQLEGDRAAAAHYGYEVITLHADMRDLSRLEDGAFDLVYQAPSTAYVPDVREVYTGVARVLRSGGLYRVCFSNPATEFVDWESWDGEGYRIVQPYAEKTERIAPGETGQAPRGAMQFRHYMHDIFSGLISAGLSIQQVEDDPQYFDPQNAEADPGTWWHWLTYVGAFAVVARKAQSLR